MKPLQSVITATLIIVGLAASVQAQSRWFRPFRSGCRTTCYSPASNCGMTYNQCSPCYETVSNCSPCSSLPCAPAPICLLEPVYCPMYPTQQLDANTFLYYSLACDRTADYQCLNPMPTALYGYYAAPVACPDCIPQTFVSSAGPDQPHDPNTFPGYPGDIKPDSFDPIETDPMAGGIPQLPQWLKPVSNHEDYVYFDVNMRRVYAKVLSINVKHERAREDHSDNPSNRAGPPTSLDFKIGFQVTPTDPSHYSPVEAEKVASKVYRVFLNSDHAREHTALVILASRFP